VSNTLTVQDETYRLPEKLLNGAATMSYKAGLSFTDISMGTILDAARKKTGLTDWGDENFLRYFEKLLEILDGAPITPLARVFIRQICIKAVVNRLKIQEYLAKHPEVRDIPVKKPIFVVGFPRTGTTVLQNLLSLPDDRRALQFWELTAPIPAHPDPEVDAARRIKATNRILQMAYLVAPEQRAIHEISATTAEECWALMANTFAVMNYDFQTGQRAWGDWLCQQDNTWAYEEYRTQLQILLHQRPAKQLVLKCPEHLWTLDALLNVFPDACVVWTHRDPVDTVASYCSLLSMNHRTYYGRFNPSTLGPYYAQRFLFGIERALEVRDARPEARVVDVRFADLVKDRKGMVRWIHEQFGLDHPEDMDHRIDAWLNSGRSDDKGKHRYGIQRYGLHADEVHAQYAAYIERFNIPVRTHEDRVSAENARNT